MRTILVPALVVIGFGIAWILAPHPAQARSLADTFRRTGLSQQDIALVTTTANKLYRTGTPQVGRSAEWSNPQSGAHGTVRLASFRDNCAVLDHSVITTRRPEPQEFSFRHCKAADGSWTLTP